MADVNKKSKDLQGELRQVEKLLKLDPKNTELVAQKQKLLAEAVENSKEKLDRTQDCPATGQRTVCQGRNIRGTIPGISARSCESRAGAGRIRKAAQRHCRRVKIFWR